MPKNYFKLNDEKIDLKKVNPVVKQILETVVIPRSRNSYSVDFGIQAIHTSLAHFATTARLEYIPSGGNRKSTRMTTYYAMSFLGSGKGKDFVTELIEDELFELLTKGFDKIITTKAISYNRKTKAKIQDWLEDGETDSGTPYGRAEYNADIKTKFMPTTVEDIGLRFGQATPEGLAYARVRIKMIDMGSPSLKIPEFSSVLSSPSVKDLFVSLTELWENGNVGAKTTKDKLLPNCKNIPILFYAYTDPNKILNDTAKQKKLVDDFSSGLGRRTFIVYPEDSDFIKKTTATVSEIEQEDIEEITYPVMKNIAKFFNFTKHRDGSITESDNWIKPIQYFSEPAKMYMDEVNKICALKEEELRGELTDGELANIISMGAKIEKLASVYAFIDGREEIDIDDCRHSTYWCSYTSKYLGKISKVLTPPERLFNMMNRKKKWVSGFEIEQAGIFPNSFDFNKSLDNTLQNLSQFCSMKNFDLVVSQKDGGTVIKVKQIPLVDRNKLVTSSMVGEHEDIKLAKTGWKKSTFKFNDLHKFISSDKQSAFSACEFKRGKRQDSNTTGKIQFIALDFDDGLSWEDGLERFKGYTFFAYQTRNHQKEKKGVTCDRFRVILLLERELIVDSVQYSSMYKRILSIVAPEADHSCTNIGRLFFNSPNSKYHYNEGKPFKAHLFLDENKTEKTYTNRAKLDGSGLKEWFMSEIDIVNSSRTGGINLLVKASFATKDTMKIQTKGEAESWVRELSNMIFDEYWDNHNFETEVMPVLNKIYKEN